MEKQRLEAHFSGYVQGVGFRFTAIRIASDYAVTGFVKNLPDGRVQLVAEGEKSDLDSFLSDIKARMSHCIRDTTVQWSNATNAFNRFGVAF